DRNREARLLAPAREQVADVPICVGESEPAQTAGLARSHLRGLHQHVPQPRAVYAQVAVLAHSRSLPFAAEGGGSLKPHTARAMPSSLGSAAPSTYVPSTRMPWTPAKG